MKKDTVQGLCAKLCAAVTSAALLAGLTLLPVRPILAAPVVPPSIPAATSGDFAAVPMTATVAARPNVLFILDNSNSMDEDIDGSAASVTVNGQVLAGSANPNSRSEIARNAIKMVINKNRDTMRFGLMAYDQQNIVRASLSNSFYYCSYNPASYRPECTDLQNHPECGASMWEIQRNPNINTKRFPNPTDPGNFIYYDTALPFYDTSLGTANQFCYSWNYTEDGLLGYCNELGQCCNPPTQTCTNLTPGHPPIGSCNGSSCYGNDIYTCYSVKTWRGSDPPLWAGNPTGPGATPPTGLTGTATLRDFMTQYGYSGVNNYNGVFGPTDDDIAQGFNQFGYENSSIYVGLTWFSNAAVGGGRLHVNIDDSTDPHIAQFYDARGFEDPVPAGYNPEAGKLGRSQFVNAVDTPLRNAGNTPMAGTLATAFNYFSHLATPTTAGLVANNPITAPCQKNFIVLVTDGLPSANAQGQPGTSTQLLQEVKDRITALHNVTNNAFPGAVFDVRTFIVGFALPPESGNQLDSLAVAGGTDVHGHAYLANNPAELAAQLQEIFQQITMEASAGTGASINTNSRSGEGGIFPPMFYPRMQDAGGRTINWAGDVTALFIDKSGRLREDTNGNHILDDDKDHPGQSDRVVIFQQNANGDVGFATPVDARPEINILTMPAATALVGQYFFINAVGDRRYYVCFNVNNTPVADSAVNGAGQPYRQRLEVTLASTDEATDVAAKTARVLTNSLVFKATAAGNKLTIENVLAGEVVDMSAGNSTIPFTIDQQGGSPSSGNLSLGNRTQISYLWSASDWLAAITDDDIVKQRDYGSTAKQRHIITFIDGAQDGIPGNPAATPAFALPADGTGELSDQDISFDSNNPALFPLIPVNGNTSGPITGIPAATGQEYMKAEIKRVINFIRGQDQPAVTLSDGTILPAFRSRQIDYKNAVRTWRLGDIIHSNPLAVDRPNQGYKAIYNDKDYARFMARYANRRTVVYVGANDGMLHAFNGGFYENRYSADLTSTSDPVLQYLLQPVKQPAQWQPNGKAAIDTANFKNYDLGAELWAYIPYNLLGHLHWLTELPNNDNLQVNHVYYVDLSPAAYDVQIFQEEAVCASNPNDPNCIHPGGWGTILVGGMGFGGGRINACVNRDWNGGNPGECTDTRAMSSSYFIFDITNPEQAPKLLIEFALPRQGYTINSPTLAYFKDKNNPSINRTFLVFGSGPASAAGLADSATLNTARSGQNARLFYLQLPSPGQSLSSAASWGVPGGTLSQCRTDSNQVCSLQIIGNNPATNGNPAYVSEMIGVDLDLDYKIDTLYFGTVVSQTDGGLSGALRRIVTNASAYPSNPSYGLSPGNWSADSLLIDLAAAGLNQPISAAANTAFDGAGNLSVYFGTGRYLTVADKANNDQQAFYGVKEPRDNTNGKFTWGTVNYNALFDATAVKISVADTNGVEVTGGAGTDTSWQNFVASMDNYAGWTRKLRTPAQLVTDGIIGTAERSLNQPAITRQLFLATSFVPTQDDCDNLGRGFLHALYYRTGTAAMGKNGPVTSLYDLGSGQPLGFSVNGGSVLVPNSGGGYKNIQLDSDLPGGEAQPRRLNWRDISQ